jgi:outer membrane protein
MIGLALALASASGAQIPDRASYATAIGPARGAAQGTPASRKTSRWFLRTGVLRALTDSGARIATNLIVIPGASAGVTDGTTVNLDIGYDLSRDVAVMFMGGIPPTVDVIGRGSVASFQKLGRVCFGPAILSGVYRLPEWHGFRPYAGAGAAHLFILKAHDGAVKKLKVHDHNGFVLQAGLEYRLSRQWELFADYKHIFLNVRAEGFLAGAPVRARVTLNPDLVSTGIKFHFG